MTTTPRAPDTDPLDLAFGELLGELLRAPDADAWQLLAVRAVRDLGRLAAAVDRVAAAEVETQQLLRHLIDRIEAHEAVVGELIAEMQAANPPQEDQG